MPQIVEDFRFRLEKALTAREVKPIELAEKNRNITIRNQSIQKWIHKTER